MEIVLRDKCILVDPYILLDCIGTTNVLYVLGVFFCPNLGIPSSMVARYRINFHRRLEVRTIGGGFFICSKFYSIS